MKDFFQQIVDWSEAWAVLIPLAIWIIYRPSQNWVRPVKIYLVFAFLINLTGDMIWKRKRLGLQDWMRENLYYFYNANGAFDNTLLYNLHSLLRLALFCWFFSYLGKIFRRLNIFVLPGFLIFAIAVFIYYKDIRDFNSLLLGTEAAVLLIYCLLYYMTMLRDEANIKRESHFWVVTGLSIYVVVNFPIFLFYTALAKQSKDFAINIWDVHNISYIVLCLFIAIGFYGARKQYT